MPYYADKLRRYVPNAEIVVLDSPREFFTDKRGDLDAFVYGAASGSSWSLIYPSFSVAIPQPDVLAVPLAYLLPRGDPEMMEFINHWIELKEKDETIERLYDYWILGEMEGRRKPRWSIIRDVLGWVN